jgi:DnaJ-class molecular chaperone
MAQDPYEILGVGKKASAAEIKAAYRKLAKTHHPDLNPGKASEARFREIGAAYGLLSDAEKRASFDRGEIDMAGQPRQQEFYRDQAAGASGRKYREQPRWDPQDQQAGPGFDAGNFSDIFSSMFGQGFGGGGSGVSLDAHYAITVDFLEAALGASKRVTMPDGKVLDLKIPAGIAEGQQLRLKGQGNKGKADTGDAYVEINIRPHPTFTRQGNDIFLELPIGFHESILGRRVPVPTIHGTVEMAIPAGAHTGRTLRLKGKGIKGGDQLVRLVVTMPPTIDPELREAIETWAKTHSYNPRNPSRSAK